MGNKTPTNQSYSEAISLAFDMLKEKIISLRNVSDFGETLVVSDYEGCKVLTDPCDQSVTVVVPVGRHARLVQYCFNGLSPACGRDHHVRVSFLHGGVGFVSVQHPRCQVLLQELSLGQQVDVLPAAEPAAAYAVVVRPLPVFYGAATVQPAYAALAAA